MGYLFKQNLAEEGKSPHVDMLYNMLMPAPTASGINPQQFHDYCNEISPTPSFIKFDRMLS